MADAYERMAFHDAAHAAVAISSRGNLFLQETAPWTAFKKVPALYNNATAMLTPAVAVNRLFGVLKAACGLLHVVGCWGLCAGHRPESSLPGLVDGIWAVKPHVLDGSRGTVAGGAPVGKVVSDTIKKCTAAVPPGWHCYWGIVCPIANHVDIPLVVNRYWQTLLHWHDQGAGRHPMCRGDIGYRWCDRVVGTPVTAHN